MKRILTSAMSALLLLAFAGGAPSAVQNKVLDFTLVNNSGVDIYKVFISPADVAEWQEDILDVDVLEDGAEVEVRFDASEEAELWDLKVEDDEGTGIVWSGLDLSKINTLILKIVEGEPVAEIK